MASTSQRETPGGILLRFHPRGGSTYSYYDAGTLHPFLEPTAPGSHDAHPLLSPELYFRKWRSGVGGERSHPRMNGNGGFENFAPLS